MTCDDTGRWAWADLAVASAGAFVLANGEGKGADSYAAAAAILTFGVSSIIGFRHARECRCLHQAWLDQSRPR